MIPPKANAEFVGAMEEVLDTYQQPRDPARPVACMDEQPVQLLEDVHPPIAESPGRPELVDHEYRRAGTASVFMFCEPLAGWRRATARERRTKVDWAEEVAELLEGRYAGREKVVLVCDNLNTHAKGAFYAAFEPQRARALASRVEFRRTPVHGSWLNVAECELSAMTAQCLGRRRIGDLDRLREELDAWSSDVNGQQRGVDWRFTVSDARCRLKHLYPKIVH